ncbi:MAG: HAMP domain-containing histidine kinase [Bacteroidales bacterium]|nr:HAMP domain-containing histidine kinase [Candidatus Sodaliphilus aphodohippi]
MKKSIIWILTAIMAFTFAGLLFAQIMYMENMIKMRNEQFSEIVTRSLYGVKTMLEQNETKFYLDQDLMEAQAAYNSPATTFDCDTFGLSTDTAAAIGNETLKKPNGLNNISDLDNSYLERQEILKGQYLYQKSLLNEVILTLLSQSSDRPISQRADSTTVCDCLRSEFENNGIKLPFEFAITNNTNSIVYSTSNYTPDNEKDIYRQELFPNDPVNKHNCLNVIFPTKGNYIFSSIKFMIPSFLFTIIMLVVFIYTIIVAFKQKRLTEIKNDFINNMTHEFKTPISSISIAAQMLNDDSVSKSPTMLKHVSSVINDETKRLRFQVEKVLQMSMFDNKSATMNLEEADADAIIDSVANTFKLKIEKYGGHIESIHNAEDPIVNVDKMHFTNVVFNLLDNAIKYRKEETPLELKITTYNPDEDNIVITVEDNGIGIKREDLKKIFEKFYRVSTGNRHDVKGFGLGLAYVHKMVTLFGGTITAESELNKGTKFIITLPLIK